MANPRQRRKIKSSAARVKQSRRQKQNLRKKKALRGPSLLLQEWDRHKTVNQNYAALGLAASFRVHASGGTEAQGSSLRPLPVQLGIQAEENSDKSPGSLTLLKGSTKLVQRGKIIRDREGNVVSVELEDEHPKEISQATPWGQPFEEDTGMTSIQPASELAKSLEESSHNSAREIRHSSKGEVATLVALVAAHGEDTDAMARDYRRNVMQQTAGHIRAAVRRAGGFDALRGRILN